MSEEKLSLTHSDAPHLEGQIMCQRIVKHLLLLIVGECYSTAERSGLMNLTNIIVVTVR